LKNAMQLKGIIKNMAAKTGIKANAGDGSLVHYAKRRINYKYLI